MNRKKSQNFQRKSHHLLRYQKLNKIKQLGFTTNWNVNDHKKDYDALQDPHANRYFRYQSVKQHIKQLRRSLGKQDIIDNQTKKITQLIKQKLSHHLPAIGVAAQTYNIPKDQLLQKSKLNRQRQSKLLVKDKSISQIDSNNFKKRRSKTKRKLNSQNRSMNKNKSIQHFNSQADKQQKTQKSQKPLKSQKSQTPLQQQQKKQELNDKNQKKNEQSVRFSNDSDSNKNKSRLKKSQNKKDSQRQQYIKQQHQILHKKKHQQFISFIAKKKDLLKPLQE